MAGENGTVLARQRRTAHYENRREWTTGEDEQLRASWPTAGLSVAVIAGQLGRTISAVQIRASRLGLGPRPVDADPVRTLILSEQEEAAIAAEPRLVNDQPSLRWCLRYDLSQPMHQFWSAGPHERTCPQCKERRAAAERGYDAVDMAGVG